MHRILGTMIGAFVVAILMASGAPAQAQTAAADPGEALKAGKATFESTCNVCHGLERPLSKNLDRAGWDAILDRMKTNGAEFDKEGRERIIGWLLTKSAFETKCSACHGADRPLSKNKSAADWLATVKRMSGKKPGHLTDADVASIAAYLSIVRPAK